MDFPNLDPAEDVVLTVELSDENEIKDLDILSFDEDLEPEM